MADPYNRYGALADRGDLNFAGYLPPSEIAPQLTSSDHNHDSVNEFRDSTSNFLHREITPLLPLQPVSYGLDNNNNNNNSSNSNDNNISSEVAGTSRKGYLSPLNDLSLLRYRHGTSINVTTTSPSVIPGVLNDRPLPNSLRISGDGPSVSRPESNILFVDGLPTDCTRREVGHLFRPFIGYKDIKVIHKEPRRSGDKATVFCFVEFVDVKCAITAMETLQGYKFDDRKPNSPILRIQFAQFPFRPPRDHDEQRIGIPH